MNTFVYNTQTNDTQDSQYNVLGHLMPARMFVFVIVDEPGTDGFLVRRVYTSIEDPYLQELELSPLQARREVFPDKYGLWGRDPNSTASIAEHVMGYEKITSFASASSQFPDGAARMAGKVIYVDIAKAKRSGARLVTTQEIRQSLQTYVQQHPHLKNRVNKILNYAEGLDREVLVQPDPRVPPSGIFTKGGLAVSLGIVKYARVVQVVGVAFTAYDLGVATDQSFKTKSIRPIEKEVVRQIGGWGGAIAGAKMGAATGALVGIETGPGTIITGLIGGIVFGAIGYFGGSAVADQIPDK
ncbi:glycine zipper family protein [Cupriavidus oxalaticus]|uniref:Glycine zipper family protein n=1 Tax=Cupriavidus oxalaticus TaxID=96344 RepID=A0A5P3VH52_9BURK|nr:glycine zipper family protein [Cupriavidus oxalaticus]QEZ45245.1 glycine zipper family protein [Cupriavidus oxalaticus]